MAYGYRPVVCKIRCVNPNKKSTKARNYNLLHYIATREGVDLTRVRSTVDAAINSNVDFNAKGEELVFDEATNDGYLKYMANRPRSHGLFGNIDTENFSDVAKLLNEVSAEKKPVYRGVISLSELDAQQLGYNNASQWNMYLNTIMPDIAANLRISPNNHTWVAAFHAEQKHPHVHFMLWDNRDIIKTSFIHYTQQQKCQKLCQEEMFTEDYQERIRDLIQPEYQSYTAAQNKARQEVVTLTGKMFSTDETDEKMPGRLKPELYKELNRLYVKVLENMPGESHGGGRINYGFMPLECKAYIDRISDLFMKQPDIAKEYRAFLKATEDMHICRGEDKKEVAEKKNAAIKEMYTRTGNVILKNIFKLRKDILQEYDRLKDETAFEGNVPELMDETVGETGIDAEPGINDDENNLELDKRDIDFLKHVNQLINEKNKSYNPVEAEKLLLQELENEDTKIKAQCWKSLAKIYGNDYSVMENYEKALHYLDCYSGVNTEDFDVHVLYGKIYSDKHHVQYDAQAAEEHYLKAIEVAGKRNHNFVKLKLSRLYADSESVICDYDEAINIISDANDFKGSVSLQEGNIFNNENCYFKDSQTAFECYMRSAEKGNYYGGYFSGKRMVDETDVNYNFKLGLDYLEQAAPEVIPAHILLGRIYQNKNKGAYSLLKAHNHFSEALEMLTAKENKEYCKISDGDKKTKAQLKFYLGKIYATPENMLCDYDKAINNLKQCISIYEGLGETNNVFINQSHIMLGQIYADKEAIHYNPYMAEAHYLVALKNSEVLQEQGNEFNSTEHIALQLNKLYTDESSPLWNLDSAMDILRYGVNDKNGIFLLKRGDIFADEKYHAYNMKAAIECYKQAAEEKDNTTAMVRIAKCYLYGIGVEKDKQQGMNWLSRAADAGDEYAKEYMKNIEEQNFKGYTYALLRQLFSNMTHAKNKSLQKLQEAEFRNDSKQAKKERYLHQD